jgi:DNA-binding XRE family transcriptional regulator
VAELGVCLDEQARAAHAGDVAWLYMQGKPHAEIGEMLGLTSAQTYRILSGLLAEGMPALERRGMSEETVRAIHAAHVRGDGSIDRLAESIGFTGSAARRRMRRLKLPTRRQPAALGSARSPAHAEQRVITGLLMARVDELRKSRRLSIERLAQASDLSLWTIYQLRRDCSDPQLTTVLRLCRGLDITAGELLDELPLPVAARAARMTANRSEVSSRDGLYQASS